MSSGAEATEDDRFEEILRLEGLNIQNFYKENPEELFPNAKYFPEFFNQNLVNPNRVLKQFLDDPQSNIRIFYLQLLRLAFEVPTDQGSNHVCLQNLKKIVFHPQFQILFTPDTDSEREVFNDFQFKKLFAEFISLLLSAAESEPLCIQQALNQFPIIDDVMVHIIRSLLVSFNIKVPFDQKIPTDLLFKQLSSVLQLSLTSYGNCWKFQESDMFCFEESQNELYLAYILDDFSEEAHNHQDSQAMAQEEHHHANAGDGRNTFLDSSNTPYGIDPILRPSNWNASLYDAQMQPPQNIGKDFKFEGTPAPYLSPLIADKYGASYNPSGYNNHSLNTNQNNFTATEVKIDVGFERLENSISAIKNEEGSFQHSSRYQSVTRRSGPTVQNFEPTPRSYQQSAQHFQTTTHPNPNPTSTYNYQSRVTEATFPSIQNADYNRDFTPTDILNQLRPQNRENILLIKEYFRNLRRGGQLPFGFDLRASVIRPMSNVQTSKSTRYPRNQPDYGRPYSTHLGPQQWNTQETRVDYADTRNQVGYRDSKFGDSLSSFYS